VRVTECEKNQIKIEKPDPGDLTYPTTHTSTQRNPKLRNTRKKKKTNNKKRQKMPEQILLQIGQAGNQIGAKFWECALKEHAALNNGMKYTQAEASYFKNTEEG